jgi:ribosomal protein S18 acetylase RimI-like enzyme
LKSWFFHPHHQKSITDTPILNSCQFQIRTATSADLLGISQIIAESFHSQKGLWAWAFPLFRLGIYEDFRYRLASMTPYQICLVAVNTNVTAEHQVLGTVEMNLRFGDGWTNVQKFYPYLSNLAVHPQHRRYGLASSLLISCEQVCKDWGFEDLYLHVLENNHQARQLYFKLGYRVHGVQSNWNSFLFYSSRQILLHKRLKRAKS